MNVITKHPIDNLGYNFIAQNHLPDGKDEYYLRDLQNSNGTEYRNLTGSEIAILIRNNNASDNWSKILVSKKFDPALVKNSKFHGLVRIGMLEPYYLEFHNLRMQVGIYNSQVISCDLGDNVCIDNCNYLSHYIIGNEVMIANVNELATTDYAKFGNGILKSGETEKIRIWIELRNENGGRAVIPFNSMVEGDAALWSSFPDDKLLAEKLKELTTGELDHQRGYYGTIGERTVIKDCDIIKDAKIGSDAYIKGANKLKNLTINSDAERKSQIGEGCEMVNGIIGFGCQIFYGVKAVRFIMAPHSQLKYGARLINSYLGSNSTISCCEVLHSLIYPGHEQHHNNSFLTAALVMGQSNIAAGATIGSNHNSRGADGELIAGRGFWPGLCVSLKHNSKFASYTILVKGDYPYEMNISIPFCLISNDETEDKLVIRPGYWFRHNMYALARNAWKYGDRDKRTEEIQHIEYDFLAPDTINEMMDSIQLLSALLPDDSGNALVEMVENSHRAVEIKKVHESIGLFKELICYHAMIEMIRYITENKIKDFETLKSKIKSRISRENWINLGGQLVPETELKKLMKAIRQGQLKSWDKVHEKYKEWGALYPYQKFTHAINALFELEQITKRQFTLEKFSDFLKQAVKTKTWMTKGIYQSREKDYTNPFRKMVYQSREEMNTVIGKIENNQFIQLEYKNLDEFKKSTTRIIRRFKKKK